MALVNIAIQYRSRAHHRPTEDLARARTFRALDC